MEAFTSSGHKSFNRSQKLIFAVCYYSFFVNGGLTLILGSILPFMKNSYKLDYVIVGMLLSMHAVGNLVSSFIAGVLPIYLGRRKSILLLSGAGVIGLVFIILTKNAYLL